MCTVKTQKHRFPFIIIFAITPNDTRIHVILKVPRTISSTVAHVCFNDAGQE